MAIAMKLYGKVNISAFNKEIDLDSDTLKVMLVGSGYTVDQDTHQYKSSITSEVTGAGYTAGGLTLTGVTVSYNAATNELVLDANDATWPTATLAGVQKVILYDGTPASDSTRPLIAYGDFGGTPGASTAADFTIQWDATGIVRLAVA